MRECRDLAEDIEEGGGMGTGCLCILTRFGNRYSYLHGPGRFLVLSFLSPPMQLYAGRSIFRFPGGRVALVSVPLFRFFVDESGNGAVGERRSIFIFIGGFLPR